MYIFPRGGREAGISVDLCVLCSCRCDIEVRVAGTRDHRGRTRVPSLLRPSFPDPQDAGAEHCLSRLLSGCRCGGETQPGASAGSAKGPWARDGRPSRALPTPGGVRVGRAGVVLAVPSFRGGLLGAQRPEPDRPPGSDGPFSHAQALSRQPESTPQPRRAGRNRCPSGDPPRPQRGCPSQERCAL